MKRIYILILIIIPTVLEARNEYKEAFDTITSMLDKNQYNFKKSIFYVENAYLENPLEYTDFTRRIDAEISLIDYLYASTKIEYNEEDSISVTKHATVFRFFSDTTIYPINDSIAIMHSPYVYNKADSAGINRWESTFVTELLISGKGNCRSLTFLYKILIEELEEKAWLSLAPKHIYIKNHNKRDGWFNTELSSYTFPRDISIISSTNIHLDAITNRLYMDTLSNQQTMAMCLTDLAMGYMRKYPDKDKEFALQCCNKTLEYYPNYITALLLKSILMSSKLQKGENNENELIALIRNIHNLGYRKQE